MNPTWSLRDLPPPCSDCGIGLMEFRNSGRLGCPRDYECFRDHLRPLLEHLHRSCVHQGKKPARWRGPVSQFSEHRQMRRALAAAVAADDFEQASQIRDAIRQKDRQHGL